MLFFFYLTGTVGKPFPSVEVCISRPNVYAKNGYDVLAFGNSKGSTITPGKLIIEKLHKQDGKTNGNY